MFRFLKRNDSEVITPEVFEEYKRINNLML